MTPLHFHDTTYRVGFIHEHRSHFPNTALFRMATPTTDSSLAPARDDNALATAIRFPADVPEPTVATRLWRFWNVVWLAARVYVGYKGTQLWTRLISDRNKPDLYITC